MHGRVKDKNISEQERLVKQLVREKKLAAFETLKCKVLSKRDQKIYDAEGLDLTSQLLLAGAAEFYTLWNYRCEILSTICKGESCPLEEWERIFKEELQFNEKCIFVNPKSYAIYNHRCWLFEHLLPSSLKSLWFAELSFTDRLLAADERNFHTWDYRRWLFQHWPADDESKPTWSSEMAFSRDLIAKNMSNYSAWHYRNKLLASRLASKEEVDWKSEFELINNALYTDPNDQSAWWYFNSLIELVCPSRARINSNEQAVVNLVVKLGQAEQVILLLSCDSPLTKEEALRRLPSLTQKDLSTVDDSVVSPLWVARINKQTISEIEFSDRKVNLREIGQTAFFQSSSAENTMDVESEWLVTREFLSEQLQSLRDLVSLEPENKHAKLTLVRVKRIVEPYADVTELISLYSTVASLDSMRKNYYDDMKSSSIVSSHLSKLNAAETVSLDLSKLELTYIPFCTVLFKAPIVVRLDLSSNKLKKLSKEINLLQQLEELNLDGNELEDVNAIRGMLFLKNVSLHGNKLQTVTGLSNLAKTCPSLQTVNLTGNPISDNKEAVTALFLSSCHVVL